MKYPHIQIAHREEQVERLNLVAGSLPQWKQLPPTYQRELVLVLSGLLVKQLPLMTSGPKERHDEQA